MILNDLKELRTFFKDKIIVLCHGCFDIFHYGHLTYLKKSKEMGDILVVSLTNDYFVNKGVNRPICNIQQRLEFINELHCVDFCCISDDYNSRNIIKELKPNIYVKGMDAKGKEINSSENLFYERIELESIGGKLVFIDLVPNLSSTNIIRNCIFSVG